MQKKIISTGANRLTVPEHSTKLTNNKPDKYLKNIAGKIMKLLDNRLLSAGCNRSILTAIKTQLTGLQQHLGTGSMTVADKEVLVQLYHLFDPDSIMDGNRLTLEHLIKEVNTLGSIMIALIDTAVVSGYQQTSIQQATRLVDALKKLSDAMTFGTLDDELLHGMSKMLGLELTSLFPGLKKKGVSRAIQTAHQNKTNALHNRMSLIYNQSITEIFQGFVTHTPVSINLLMFPIPTKLEKPTETQLNIIIGTIDPGRSPNTMSVREKWLTLVGYIHGVKLTKQIILTLLPQRTGQKTAIRSLVKAVPTGCQKEIEMLFKLFKVKLKGTRGNQRARWKNGRSWLIEVCQALSKTQNISQGALKNIQRILKASHDELTGICSVGADFQLLIVKLRVMSELSGKTDSTVIQQTLNYCFQRVPKLLLDILPQGLAYDVHHVNLAIRQIGKMLGATDEELSGCIDPYQVGARETIHNHSKRLHTNFTDIAAFLDYFSDTQGLSALTFLAKEDYVTFTAAPNNIQLDEEQGCQFIESAIENLSLDAFNLFELSPQHILDVNGLLIKKGQCHGLLGIAARLGKARYFQKLQLALSQHLEPAHLLSVDGFGCTLLDHAARGGDVTLFKAVWEKAECHPELGPVLTRQTTLPSVIGLAAESGNPAMIEQVFACITARLGEKTALELLTQKDDGGHTPLMRAVMSKNLVAVKTVLNLLGEKAQESVNQTTTAGQSPLILAIDHGNGDIIEALLKSGAAVNYKMPATGLSSLHLAMITGNARAIATLCQSDTIDLMIKDVDGKTPIDYVTNTLCLTQFLDAAFKKLDGPNLATLLTLAVKSGRLSGRIIQRYVVQVRTKNITGKALADFLEAAIESKKLDGSGFSECIISGLTKPKDIPLLVFITDGNNMLKLNPNHWKAIIELAADRLKRNGSALSFFLQQAVIYDAPHTSAIDRYTQIAFRLLKGDRLSDVIELAVTKNYLDSEQLTSVATNSIKKLDGDNLAYVIETIIESGKLDLQTIKRLVQKAKEKVSPAEFKKLLNAVNSVSSNKESNWAVATQN